MALYFECRINKNALHWDLETKVVLFKISPRGCISILRNNMMSVILITNK